jgi:small multidrug resistance pump
MTWLYLVLAVLLEVGGAICMKQSEGFSRLLPSVLMFGFFAASIAALTMTARQLGIGVSYAVWGGLATTLITLIGTLFFNETLSLGKLVGIALIGIGVALINLTGAAHEKLVQW